MKTDNLNESNNIEDRRSEGYSSGYSGYSQNRSSGGAGGALLAMLFSRMGWKGKILLVMAFLLFGGGLSNLGGLLTDTSSLTQYQTSQTETVNTTVNDADAKFMSKVLKSTEDFWTAEFKKYNRTYTPPKMVFYTDQIQTGCGIGSADGGPFYCGSDQKVYIDVSFYKELTTRYKASGDFAMAYVIAHEVGHHVQQQLGILQDYNNKHARLNTTQANALNVRLELQADYFAGAWAKYVDGQGLLDIGDIEEAMNAAHAVGDDTLQKSAYGQVMPDSFTHGTSEQRMRWYKRGYQYGDIEHGNTFDANLKDSDL